MKKFFILLIITLVMTSCVSNKKILSPEQLTQDKIISEKILGSWNYYPTKGRFYEIDFYKNNTSLWQTIAWNYTLWARVAVKMYYDWKIENNKIILNFTKVNFSFPHVLGEKVVFDILEFSDSRMVLKSKDGNGNEVIMIRQE